MKKILCAVLLLSYVKASDIETMGDIFQILIPASAYGYTLYEGDKKAEMEFYQSFGTTIGLTHLLKYTVQEERPDGTDSLSFPSGHTSSAFGGASFIHRKYGWKNAIVPYMLASFVGYSRVHAEKHYVHDVVAGAALAIASTWYFVTPSVHLELDSTQAMLYYKFNY